MSLNGIRMQEVLWTSPFYITHFIDLFEINASYIFHEMIHETKMKSLLAMISMIHILFLGEITSNKVIDSLPLLKDYATRSKKFAFFAWSLKFHFQLLLWLAAFWNCCWVFYFRMHCNKLLPGSFFVLLWHRSYWLPGRWSQQQAISSRLSRR